MKVTAVILGFVLFTTAVSALATRASDQLKSSVYAAKNELANLKDNNQDAVEVNTSEIPADKSGEVSAVPLQSLRRDAEHEFIQLSTNNTNALAERGVTGIICCPVAGQDWGFTSTNTIFQGIQYLDGVKAPCHAPARTCVRVSCSYNSAIYLCNDNYNDIYPSCTTIGQFAQDLMNRCVQTNPFLRLAWTCGQEFDSGGFNVIVRADSC